MSQLAAISSRLDELLYEHAEMKRKMACVIRSGTVKSFRAADNTAVVDVGFDTHDVPVFNHAGSAKNWHPLKAGQQVTLLCSDGDLANAVIIPGGFHDANAAPSASADEDIVSQRGDGGSAVHMRVQDRHIAFENKRGKSAVRARNDGIIHLKVKSLDLLKIVIGDSVAGDTAYMLDPAIFIPTELDREGLPS